VPPARRGAGAVAAAQGCRIGAGARGARPFFALVREAKGVASPPTLPLLCSVQILPIRAGLRVGLFAAAATGGMLAGFGLRQGTPARPFNLLATAIAGDRAAGTWGFDPVATTVGAAVHVLVVCGYGLLFVYLLREIRGSRPWVVATLLAAALCGATLLLAPLLFGGIARTVLQPVQIVALHVVLGVALVSGMRLALFDDRAGTRWRGE
jgi:hypothetical protein